MRYAARVFIKNNDGLYLALNQVKWGFYVLPGGKAEPGESLENCVIRETKEETNLILRNAALLYKHWWPWEKDKDGLTMAYFKADSDLSNLKIMEPHKHLDYKFMTFAELGRQKNRLFDDIFQELKSRIYLT